MKVTYFQQVPYRHLPDDFEQRFESVITTPYFEQAASISSKGFSR